MQELMTRSREYQARKWDECFKNFEACTATTLEGINNPRTVMVGSLGLLSDLLKYNPLERIAGFVPFPSRQSDCYFSGVRLLSLDDVLGLRRAEAGADLNMVLCSFKDQAEVTGLLRTRLGERTNILCPTRISGMDHVFFQFGGSLRPSKAFALQKIQSAAG